MTNLVPAIEICQADQIFRVGFWLKPAQILKNITFSVRPGVIFGFLGANGAGKTTLIHLITGLRRPTRGHVRIFGFDADSFQARARLGYLPERPYFHEHLTGAEFLKYFGGLSGMKSQEIRSEIPKVLSTVGLLAAKDIQLRNYSKGMLQRVGIAQTLIHHPEVLVLDEPMSGLDPLGRKEIRELILDLSSQGKTVFFSTHVIPDVEAICDEIALIEKGKLIGAGKLSEFTRSASGQMEVYFGELDGTADPTGWKECLTCFKVSTGFRATVSENEIEAMVMRVFQAKGKLYSVQQVHSSLEDHFSVRPNFIDE